MVRISTPKGEKRFKELTDLVGSEDAAGLALFTEFTEQLQLPDLIAFEGLVVFVEGCHL